MTPKPLITDLPSPKGGAQPYKPANKLEGKKALITGGDSGIGRSIAVMYAMEGADVFLAYLPAEEKDAQDTKAMVEKHGRKCILHPTDLTKRENCQAAADAARKELGTVNILVLNHGTQTVQEDISDISEEQWHETFNTNIHPFFYLSKYLRPHMQAGDTIITNASVNAYIGRPDLLDYTSTKGAIISFTRGLANMLIATGIRVNAIAPGPIWTPLIPATMGQKQQEGFTTPMGRPVQPSEVATSFVFLASADSSAISGQTIHVNGGMFTTS